MKIRFSRLALDYDHNYGVLSKTGWSVAIDGHYITQLQPSLFVALFKTIRFLICHN